MVIAAIAFAAAVVATATVARAMSFGEWSSAVNAESITGTSGNLNTAALEGCSFVDQHDDILYFASNRSGGAGKLDIWYSRRTENGTWGDPVNFTAVNSPEDEFCPTAHRNGKTFLFISKRNGFCGEGDNLSRNGDIYATRLHATRGWSQPQNLGCTVNSPAEEAGPYLLEDELYFSSTRAAAGDGNIYVSAFDGQTFATPALVPGVNSPQDDFRPNLRRNGLEMFFDSNRPGSALLDLWSSTRASTSDAWSAPQNLGPNVNSSANDLRASLSWDGTTLYFGSTRGGGEGSQDVYLTTRAKVTGQG